MRQPLLIAVAFCVFANFTLRAGLRDTALLDSDWRFKQGDSSGAEAVDFNDADWGKISIPHNWGWEQAQQGKPYLRGPGWYRRTLVIEKPADGRRNFLRFEAAGSVADVYLNGKLLGEHRGAFGAFSYEITSALSSNGTNLLAVRVNNEAQPDIAPISGDFNVYGGLYRPVHLITTDAICFTPTDHASPGVAWLETSVTAERAVLDITAEISNPSRQVEKKLFVARIVDDQGHDVATESQTISIGTNQTAPYMLRVTLPNPHLWNGRKDPYLYKAVVELHDVVNNSRTLRDSVEQPLGLRSYSVDPDKGFFLNGQAYHLHGVDRHQDRADKGWALTEADQDEDIALLKEMGCTVVRCSHYQQSDYFYSLCDKAGILVWAEIPQVDLIGHVPQFEETSRSQLEDLIRQNINHPSIFTWSLFNELRFNTADPNRELQDLNIVAHGEDPTRPTIAATCVMDHPQINKIPDLLGWNIYPGWYPQWGSLTNFGTVLDNYRATSRSGGLCVSEYGAGANIAQHEENPKEPSAGGQWHPEEWQATLHEHAWAQMKVRPFVWGTFIWNMFDFAVASRHEGGIAGRNDKGLVTFDHKTKKDAFYFYKANWNEEPMVYITSHRFTDRTNAVTDVKIYSNAQNAELLVNGVSQGTQPNDGNAVFVWPKVKLSPGENKIEARAQRNGRTVNDNCTWTLKAP